MREYKPRVGLSSTSHSSYAQRQPCHKIIVYPFTDILGIYKDICICVCIFAYLFYLLIQEIGNIPKILI